MGERTEIVGLRRNGEEFPAEASLSRLETHSGSIFTTILRDVTIQKAARDELLDAKFKAEAASKAKSRFLANMSHELRTPLNAIIGFSHLLMDETLWPPEKKKQRDYAKDIHASGKHLLALINDLLDISRIEAGAIRLNEEATRVDELIESCLKMVRPKAVEAGIEIQLNIADDLPAVRVDRRLLSQAALNLLSNAVKFTPSGGRIDVSALRTDRSGVAIDIRDTGIGMTDKEIRRVGQPFVQADSNLNRRYEGAGLGLAITKGLIALHDGQLVLESTPGIGTSASIQLPPARVLTDPISSAAD
jgi:signal transduction histidine kinase